MAIGQWETERLLQEMEQRILQQIDRLEENLNEKLERIMTEQTQTQNDVDAATQALTGLVSDIEAQKTTLANIEQAIQAYISSQPASADTTALDAIVSQVQGAQSDLDTAVSNVQGAVPSAPAPVTGSN